VVFIPVTLLYGVSRFLFTALALAVVISLFASYFVALTVVPLFCARFIKSAHGETTHKILYGDPTPPLKKNFGKRFNERFAAMFDALLVRALLLWGTTLNVMSLMGVVMLAGIALSNSILIVEFAHHLIKEGMKAHEAIVTSCRVRLRPILMASLATVIGLLPMALKLGEGSESYAPLAQALIGGLTVSVLLTIFLVPAGFLLVYQEYV
jgi:multidrug efflux pump subunit AcrB